MSIGGSPRAPFNAPILFSGSGVQSTHAPERSALTSASSTPVTPPCQNGVTVLAAELVGDPDDAELVPELALDCAGVDNPAAPEDAPKGEVAEGVAALLGLPLTPTAVLDPPTEAGVLMPAVDDGTAELGAAAMLKSELLENTWLILVMLTASKVYWSPAGTTGSSTVSWLSEGLTLFAMAIAWLKDGWKSSRENVGSVEVLVQVMVVSVPD